MQLVVLAEPGGGLVEESIKHGGGFRAIGAVVEHRQPLPHLVIPRCELLRGAQVKYRGRQPQPGAGQRIGFPERRQYAVSVIRLPESTDPQRQRFGMRSPIERRAPNPRWISDCKRRTESLAVTTR